MKETAFLFNASRGPIVDEAALIQVLKSRKFAWTAWDVFDLEPLPHDQDQRKLDNVLLSPHMGYISDENYETFYNQTVENVLNFIKDGNVRIVGPDKGMSDS